MRTTTPHSFGASNYISLILTMILTIFLPVVYPAPSHRSEEHVQSGESIQDAINAASHGECIYVGPGTYAEQLTIATDGIRLIGATGAILIPPAVPTKNTCSGLAGNGTQAGICVTGANVVLADFVVEHRKVVSVGRRVCDVSISGFEVRGFSGQNIAVVGTQDACVSDNKLIDGPTYGFLTVGSINTRAEGNVVSSTTTTTSLLFIAMCMDDTSPAHFHHNDVSGYAVGYCVQTAGADVQDNSAHDTCLGVFVDPGVAGAQIKHNHIYASNPLCGNQGCGITVDGALDTQVEYNVVEGQVGVGPGAGAGTAICVLDDPTTTPISVAEGNLVQYNILLNNDRNVYVNTTGTNEALQN